VRCAKQRHHITQILASKFLLLIYSQSYTFDTTVYKRNSKYIKLLWSYSSKHGRKSSSETWIMSTIHCVVSKHRITSSNTMYGCIVTRKSDFLFQALYKLLRLCSSNIKVVTDKLTNMIPFFQKNIVGRHSVCQPLFTWLYAQKDCSRLSLLVLCPRVSWRDGSTLALTLWSMKFI
jgi:hypothetical protein